MSRRTLLACLLLTACGGKPPSPAGAPGLPGVIRLLEHLTPDVPQSTEQKATHEWKIPHGSEESPFEGIGAERAWIIDVATGLSGGQLNTTRGFAMLGGSERRVTARAEVPLLGLTFLDVTTAFQGPGPGAFRLRLEDASGALLFESKSFDRKPSKYPHLHRCPLPRLGAGVATVHLDWIKGKAPFAIVSMEARRDSIAALLPAPGSPQIWSAGPIARPSIGLVAGSPLSATVTVPPHGALRLAATWPRALCATTEAPRVKIRVTPPATQERAGASYLSMEYEMTPIENEWTHTYIDLTPFGGQDILIQIAMLGELGAVVLGDGTITSRNEGDDPATVLLVTSDTHRADYLSAAQPGFELATPVIDQLASQGAYFTDCSATANITNPSHVAIMTGMSPRDSRVTNNLTPIREDASTLAEHFRAAGYRTLAVLSTAHLGQEHSGLSQGFDRVYTPESGAPDGSDAVDLALSWIAETPGRPVFLWVHLFDAHTPYAPPEDLAEKHLSRGGHDTRSIADTLDSIPGWIAAHDLTLVEEPELLYRGEVEDVDALMGRLLEVPRIARGLVAFTADHGESFGDEGVWWSHSTLAPANLMVPLILSGPGVEAQVVRTPVQQVDVGRTLLRLADLGDAPFPGRDLLTRDASETEPRFAISAHGYSASITAGTWHLELYLQRMANDVNGRIYEAGHTQLTHLEDVPPRQDRLDSDFERGQRMRTALIRWLSQAEGNGIAASSLKLDAEAQAEMAALGYSSDAVEVDGAWWNPDQIDPKWRERFDD